MKTVPQHKPAWIPSTAQRHREYQRTRQDKEVQRFYWSAAWLKLRRYHLAHNPLCEHCKIAGHLVRATIVHHRIPLKIGANISLHDENLESLCKSCHSRLHTVGGEGL